MERKGQLQIASPVESLGGAPIQRSKEYDGPISPLIREARRVLTAATVIEPDDFSPPGHRLGIVVPVYRELSNGHIIDLLDSFARQTADKNAFFIVLVINNPPDAPFETKEENRATVEIVKYLIGKSDKLPETVLLSPAQRAKLVEIRNSGLKTVAIDLTNGVRKHMGLIRAVGSLYALERGLVDSNDTFLAWIDADSHVGPQYCQKLVSYFSRDPSVDGLFLPIDYYAEGNREVFETSYWYRFDMIERYFRTVLLPSAGKGIGGSFLVARKRVWSSVIYSFPPNSERDEDFIASKRLHRVGKMIFYPEVTVTTADRIYREGFDARIRQEALVGMGVKRMWINLKVRILDLMLSAWDKGAVLSEERFKEILEFCGIPYDRELLNALGFETVGEEAISAGLVDLNMFKEVERRYLEKMRVPSLLGPLEYAHTALDFLRRNVSSEEARVLEEFVRREREREKERSRFIRRTIVQVFERIRRGRRTPQSWEEERLLKRMPWLEDDMRQNISLRPETYIEKLSREFPDMFSNSPIKEAYVELRGALLFLYTASSEGEDKFPSVYRLWDYLRDPSGVRLLRGPGAKRIKSFLDL